MRIYKPDTVHHEGNSLFSISIDKDSSRIATSGGGESCGLICIWDGAELLRNALRREVETIKDSSSSSTYCTKLAELMEHEDCVNCVRWSPEGSILASGSDDKTIIVWQLEQSVITTEGVSLINKEYWKSRHKLVGHSGDVLDIAWSPCGGMIASASVDSTIVIWDARNLPAMIAKLSSHNGFVKGIAFDPLGEYLASQSEDHSLMIWSVCMFTSSIKNLKPTKIISEPFVRVSGSTQFLRLNWSPDGSYLISAHASNSSVPVSAIISRKDWSSDLSAVGHKTAICCVSFNPNVYLGPDGKEYLTVCATASRDGAVAIWKFPLRRPLCVINKLFDSSVTDLCWTYDGQALLLSSNNGTICILDFEPAKEFSKTVISKLELQKLRETLKSARANVIGEGVPIPADSRFLKHAEARKSECDGNSVGALKETPTSTGSKPVVSSSAPTAPAKVGLKRVQPTLLAAPKKEQLNKICMNEDDISTARSTSGMNRLIGNTIDMACLINPVTKNVIIPNVAIPKIKEELVAELNSKIGLLNVHAKNSGINDIGGATLSFKLNDKQLWCQQVTSKIAILKLTSKHIIYMTDDDQLFFLDHEGWSVMPNLLLPAGSAGLFVHDEKFVFAVQKTGTFYLWNIEEKRAVYYEVKLPFVANKRKRVHLIHLTMMGNNSIMAIYNDQSAYVYHDQLKSWSTICTQFSSANSLKPYLMATIDRAKDTPLSLLTEVFSSTMKDEGGINDEKYCISFFMNQLSTLLFMKLKEEFMNTFNIFVKYLSDRNNEQLMRRLCEHVNNASLDKFDIYRVNINEGGKRLLSIILRIIESNINLQSLYRKYELYI